ncbi:MAG: hypothetical protein GY810_29950 [Aureispira sp.]|nr:hypothetical protein [Aureispira sp.]
MKGFQLIGGARIGTGYFKSAKATFPFAKLKVERTKLELSVFIIGNYSFAPQDIISIEPYRVIPILGTGIKINHRVKDYKKDIIFWTFSNPEMLIAKIKNIGFLGKIDSTISKEDQLVFAKQDRGLNPIKKPFFVGAVILWNLLFITDILKHFNDPDNTEMLGLGATIALGLLFLGSLLTYFSKSFQKLILKEERDFNDIRVYMNLLILVSGGMFMFFLFLL